MSFRAWVVHWRFGQFIVNFLGWLGQRRDAFFPEEDEMLFYLKQYARGLPNEYKETNIHHMLG